MTIKVSRELPMNATGEIVVEKGSGSQSVSAMSSTGDFPLNTANNKIVLNIGDNVGVVSPTADGILDVFIFAHNHYTTPVHVSITPKNLLSAGFSYITWDAINITVHYLLAPDAGALSFSYGAYN